MMMWILLILLALAAVVFAVAPCLGDKALRAPFQNRNCAHRSEEHTSELQSQR